MPLSCDEAVRRRGEAGMKQVPSWPICKPVQVALGRLDALAPRSREIGEKVGRGRPTASVRPSIMRTPGKQKRRKRPSGEQKPRVRVSREAQQRHWASRSPGQVKHLRKLLMHLVRLCATWEGEGIPTSDTAGEDDLACLAAVMSALEAHHERWAIRRKKALAVAAEQTLVGLFAEYRRGGLSRADLEAHLCNLAPNMSPREREAFLLDPLDFDRTSTREALRAALARAVGMSEESLRPDKCQNLPAVPQPPTFERAASRPILRRYLASLDASVKDPDVPVLGYDEPAIEALIALGFASMDEVFAAYAQKPGGPPDLSGAAFAQAISALPPPVESAITDAVRRATKDFDATPAELHAAQEASREILAYWTEGTFSGRALGELVRSALR